MSGRHGADLQALQTYAARYLWIYNIRQSHAANRTGKRAGWLYKRAFEQAYEQAYEQKDWSCDGLYAGYAAYALFCLYARVWFWMNVEQGWNDHEVK
ncbi:MAG: hypothetical protein COA91_02095 [Robiginitomaculum sp.]|nr:MAG: hypothetical protein COA91_02095 [Robiginitomaculum sp.]